MNDNNKNIVTIDSDLKDLIPGFLGNRKKDVDKLRTALSASDFDTIKSIGHSLKGVGGGYGFHEISRIGAEIEESAKIQSQDGIDNQINELNKHLNSVEVKFG